MANSSPTAAAALPSNQRWYRGLSRRDMAVLMAASLGWLFDAMDQRIFILARGPAIAALTPGLSAAARADQATWATALFIAGWATGGLIFGFLGDRLGRVRTMMMTILIYSVFTALSAAAVHVWDFTLYRFLTGLGIGGEFAAGVALVAEVLPARSRAGALGFLQVMAIIGTVLGTGLSMLSASVPSDFAISGWRLLFLFGLAPALLLVVFRRRLGESEAWTEAKAATGVKVGDLQELFGPGPWRRVALWGMVLGMAGQLGIWGAGTWTPELIRSALAKAAVDKAGLEALVSRGLILKDIGSCAGIYVFAMAAARFGRKPTFAVALIAAFAINTVTFLKLTTVDQMTWMMPLLGFCCWSLLGGYALYFPELFPTRLRSSGVGFCYNVARYLTALGILGLGQLTLMFSGLGFDAPLRPAAAVVGGVYLLGLVALPFLPETRHQPLPS